jgi:hypothetical protein
MTPQVEALALSLQPMEQQQYIAAGRLFIEMHMLEI